MISNNKIYPFNPGVTKTIGDQETYFLKETAYTSKNISDDKKSSTYFAGEGESGKIFTQLNNKTTAKKKLINESYTAEDVAIQNHILTVINQANNGIKNRVHPTLILNQTKGVMKFKNFPTMRSQIQQVRNDHQAIQQLASDIFFLNKNNIFLKDAHSENFLYDQENHTLHFIDLDQAIIENEDSEQQNKLRAKNLYELLDNLSLQMITAMFITDFIKPKYQLAKYEFDPLKDIAKNFIANNALFEYVEIFNQQA